MAPLPNPNSQLNLEENGKCRLNSSQGKSNTLWTLKSRTDLKQIYLILRGTFRRLLTLGARSVLKIGIYKRKDLRNASRTNGQVILPVHYLTSQWTMRTMSPKTSRVQQQRPVRHLWAPPRLRGKKLECSRSRNIRRQKNCVGSGNQA